MQSEKAGIIFRPFYFIGSANEVIESSCITVELVLAKLELQGIEVFMSRKYMAERQRVKSSQNCHRFLLLCLTALWCVQPVDAQRLEDLGPQVRKYVNVNTSKVILEHVQIIDG